MAWLQQLSDNQTALLGCAVGLLGSYGLLTLSFYSRSANRQTATPKFDMTVQTEDSQQSRRRAA
ncbi:hypothetical protein [Planctomicrobium piriforme]|uniref:Uncharacterized protein n=1 Tax=Planctomicrobium piriforme TaxID=1576369 RepID=A0A1I3PDE3_9PLAN|nr:hypothetical protein [Planctomicrobium piriforme]SFJ19578.1 hypothetical protein SAMN05421753_116118 [Planctomicrobium piriforme]